MAKENIRLNCPNCMIPLVVAERQHVEIDYCPQCRGVWLDRGELDKIIERAGRAEPFERSSDRSSNNDSDREYSRKPYKKKREGWLGELFDF